MEEYSGLHRVLYFVFLYFDVVVDYCRCCFLGRLAYWHDGHCFCLLAVAQEVVAFGVVVVALEFDCCSVFQFGAQVFFTVEEDTSVGGVDCGCLCEVIGV